MATNPTLKERQTEEMGQIFTTITVTNATDLGKADEGLIASMEIRSTVVENVLVDTGATYLCLPADVIARLGLRVLREVSLRTATGEVTTRVFRGARVALLGRDTAADCVELPPGSHALLGAIPMENMGIEPDWRRAHSGCFRILALTATSWPERPSPPHPRRVYWFHGNEPDPEGAADRRDGTDLHDYHRDERN